jgi:hypothetical protein
MLFFGNANVNNVNTVKFFIYWGMCSSCNPMYAYLNDGSGWVWDVEHGTKATIWSGRIGSYVYLHLRVYAPNPPDYMYNVDWGKYVIGSSHYDQWPFEFWSGYSEYAEDDLAMSARSQGYYVLGLGLFW